MKWKFKSFIMAFEAGYFIARLENNSFIYGVKRGVKSVFKKLRESYK